jgi:hypothetical protein
MKKWAILGVLLVATASGVGLIDRAEEPIATAGAQIKVFRVSNGFELEVTWSGGQEEDIAVLGVISPSFAGFQRAWASDPTRQGEQLIWHAGCQGTRRIRVVPSDTDRSYSREGDSFEGWSAGLTFVAEHVTLPVHEELKASATKGNPFANVGMHKRDITFAACEIGPRPTALEHRRYPRFAETHFPCVPVLLVDTDPKAENVQGLTGPATVRWKGGDSYWDPRVTRIEVSW